MHNWTLPESFQEVPINNILPQCSIEADSSTERWGATLIQKNSTLNFQGFWSKDEREKHINTKELLAILRTLESLPKDVQNLHLSIMNDNRTAVSTLAKLGSNRSTIRQQITSQILQELTKRNCSFEAHHIPGREVVLADFLSRHDHILPTEIQISQVAFNQLMKELQVVPQVDLFSTRFNAKLAEYHSSIQDKKSSQINTFTADWSKYKTLYAFPPPNLIHKVIYKWNKEGRGTLVLITPDWPTKSWYSPLQLQTKKKYPIHLQEEVLYLLTNQENSSSKETNII